METCPKCQDPVKAPENAGWFAGGQAPTALKKCPGCRALWATFEVPGHEPVALNLRDRPESYPMSDWVAEQLAAATTTAH